MLISAVVVSIVSAASTLFGEAFAIVTFVVSLIGFVLCIIFRHKPLLFRLITVSFLAAAISICCLYSLSKTHRANELVGETAVITGYIAEEPEYGNGYTVYTVKTDSVDLPGAEQDLKFCLITFSGEAFDVFDNITAAVTFRSLEEQYLLSNYADGIYVGAQTSNIMGLGSQHKNLYYYAVGVRRALRDSIYDILPYEEASVICAIMLGDKSALSDELYYNFVDLGIVHIVTVSGLHLSVICYSLLRFLQKLRIPRRLCLILTSFAVLAVMAVTGFSPSVLRAAFMFLLLLLGQYIFSEPDSLNLLGCAIVLILFIDPFLVFSTQLQLSSLSTLGILVGIPLVEKYILSRISLTGFAAKIVRYSAVAFFQSVVATVFTLPAVCLSIGKISLISPIASVLLIYPATIALTVSVPAVLLSVIPFMSVIYKPMFLLSGVVTKLFINTVNLLCKVPITIIDINRDYYIVPLLLCAILIMTVCVFYPNRRTISIAVAGVMLILSLHTLFAAVVTQKQINITVISCQNGKSAVVVANAGRAAVFCPELDNLDHYTLQSVLLSKGISSIDLLALTESDLRSEVNNLTGRFTVHGIIAPSSDTESLYNFRDDGIVVAELENAELDLWGKVEVRQFTSDNGMSFLFESQETAFAVAFPENSGYILPEDLNRAHSVMINKPYPDIIPGYLNNDTVFLSSEDITPVLYDFFKDSDNVVVLNSGDILRFTMNKKIELN